MQRITEVLYWIFMLSGLTLAFIGLYYKSSDEQLSESLRDIGLWLLIIGSLGSMISRLIQKRIKKRTTGTG